MYGASVILYGTGISIFNQSLEESNIKCQDMLNQRASESLGQQHGLEYSLFSEHKRRQHFNQPLFPYD
jgi:hypothetical protein